MLRVHFFTLNYTLRLSAVPQEVFFHSRRVVSTPAGLFPLQRAFSRVQTTLIFARLEEIPVSSIFKFILSSYWEKVWSGPILEWKNPFLEISPSE